jgi:hypothetical protein
VLELVETTCRLLLQGLLVMPVVHHHLRRQWAAQVQWRCC